MQESRTVPFSGSGVSIGGTSGFENQGIGTTAYYQIQVPSEAESPNEAKMQLRNNLVERILKLKVLELGQRELLGEQNQTLMRLLLQARSRNFPNNTYQTAMSNREINIVSQKIIEPKLGKAWHFKKEGKPVKDIKECVQSHCQVEMDFWSVEGHREHIIQQTSDKSFTLSLLDEAILKLIGGSLLSFLSDPSILGTEPTLKTVERLFDSEEPIKKGKKKCILVKKVIEEEYLSNPIMCLKMLENARKYITEQHMISTSETISYEYLIEKLEVESTSMEETICKLITLFFKSFWVPASVYMIRKTTDRSAISHVALDQSLIEGRRPKMSVILVSQDGAVKALFGVVPLKHRMRPSSQLVPETSSPVIVAKMKEDQGDSNKEPIQGTQEEGSPEFGFQRQALEDKIKAKVEKNKENSLRLQMTGNNFEISFRDNFYELGTDTNQTFASEPKITVQAMAHEITNLAQPGEYINSFHFGASSLNNTKHPQKEILAHISIEPETNQRLTVAYEMCLKFRQDPNDIMSIIDRYRVSNKLHEHMTDNSQMSSTQLSSQNNGPPVSQRQFIPTDRQSINSLTRITSNGFNNEGLPGTIPRNVEVISKASHELDANQKATILVRRRFQKIDTIKKLCKILDCMEENSQKIEIQIDIVESRKIMEIPKSKPLTRQRNEVAYRVQDLLPARKAQDQSESSLLSANQSDRHSKASLNEPNGYSKLELDYGIGSPQYGSHTRIGVQYSGSNLSSPAMNLRRGMAPGHISIANMNSLADMRDMSEQGIIHSSRTQAPFSGRIESQPGSYRGIPVDRRGVQYGHPQKITTYRDR